MAELRWTLLGLGALFVLGLLLWERYKRGRTSSGQRVDDHLAARSTGASSANEHAVGAAELDADDEFDADGVGRVTTAGQRPAQREARREVPRELPVVDIDAAQAAARSANGSAARGDSAIADGSDAEDDAGEFVSQPLDAADASMRGMRVESMGGPEDAAGRAEQWIAAAGVRSLRSEDLLIQWPADDQRSIVALRVEARGSERIGGRTLRQSLLGEGFIFGKFDIFHLPLADGRVILSAASLTKPGGFALATMDAQTFLGLNLFAVLPGALPGVEALDRLVASGRLLAQRMRADLLDAQGQPLTEARLLDMRAKLAGSRAASPVGESV